MKAEQKSMCGWGPYLPVIYTGRAWGVNLSSVPFPGGWAGEGAAHWEAGSRQSWREVEARVAACLPVYPQGASGPGGVGWREHPGRAQGPVPPLLAE